MSGIKISELNKWSISDIEGNDAKNILIPVSVDGTTGALRANTLVNILKDTPSDIDANQNSLISSLQDQINTLTETIESLSRDVERRYNELLYIIENGNYSGGQSGGGLLGGIYTGENPEDLENPQEPTEEP